MHGPGDAPGQSLLVQRDIADIVEQGDLIGAGEIVVPLGGVRLEKRGRASSSTFGLQ